MKITLAFLLFINLGLSRGLKDAPPAPGPACKDCPNVVILMTDDQDYILGGWDPMNQTRASFQAEGMTSTRFKIHTPICALSRSSFQSSRYLYNIKSKRSALDSAITSGGIGHVDLDPVWDNFFTTRLRKERGYVTGLVGKCMNYGCGGSNPSSSNGRNLHLMGAFDYWYEGVYYGPGTYFDSSKCGSWPWSGSSCNSHSHVYGPATVGNKSVEFIQQVAGKGRPFLLYAAPIAPHTPFTPPSWYENGTWCDNVKAKRVPNFGWKGNTSVECSPRVPYGPNDEPYWVGGTDFHEVVSCQAPFTPDFDLQVDQVASLRCKTLLAVDDAWYGIYQALKDTGVEKNTYAFVTSDHGYNIGNHMFPFSKLLPFDHTLIIPMIFWGPGIKAGSKFTGLATQVDITPTIYTLAGLDIPDSFDGKSLAADIIQDPESAPAPTQRGLKSLSAVNRTSVYHTFYSCGRNARHDHFVPDQLIDDWSNTWVALTYDGDHGHYKFIVFDPYAKQTNFTKPYMHSLFDLDKDPYELYNIYNSTLASKPGLIDILRKDLFKWLHCSGSSCN